MPVPTDYDWSRYTPVDNTYEALDLHKSAYKNMKFALPIVQYYEITEADKANLPGIAYKIYGDVSLWRAIVEFNAINDPLNDLEIGMRLALPSKGSITAYLARQQNNQQPKMTI
jgi:hypothetical protein